MDFFAERMGFDSRANYALGLPRSRTSTGSPLCTASPSNPIGKKTSRITTRVIRLVYGGENGIRTHETG